MEDSLGNIRAFHALGLVVGVRVEGVVGHHMIFEDGFEIFLAVPAEEEAIDFGAKLLEREIGRSEDGASDMVGGIVQGLNKSSLSKSKF